MEWVWIALIGLPILGAIGAAVAMASNQNAFASLGNVQGKTLAEIVSVVGEPNSASVADEGGTLYQWIKTSSAGGYHYAMLFDAEGRCVGYTHQFTT